MRREGHTRQPCILGQDTSMKVVTMKREGRDHEA